MSTAATETQPSTGLDQSFKAAGGGKKRAAAKTLPARMGKVWAAVTVTGKEYDTNPEVKCNYCGHQFCGGVSRISQHIREKCKCKEEGFLVLKNQLIAEAEAKKSEVAAKTAAGEVLPRGAPPEGEERT